MSLALVAIVEESSHPRKMVKISYSYIHTRFISCKRSIETSSLESEKLSNRYIFMSSQTWTKIDAKTRQF
jgi:hypothetical protein